MQNRILSPVRSSLNFVYVLLREYFHPQFYNLEQEDAHDYEMGAMWREVVVASTKLLYRIF